MSAINLHGELVYTGARVRVSGTQAVSMHSSTKLAANKGKRYSFPGLETALHVNPGTTGREIPKSMGKKKKLVLVKKDLGLSYTFGTLLVRKNHFQRPDEIEVLNNRNLQPVEHLAFIEKNGNITKAMGVPKDRSRLPL